MFLTALVIICGMVIIACLVGALHPKSQIRQGFIFVGPSGAVIGYYLGTRYDACIYQFCLPPEGCAILGTTFICLVVVLSSFAGDWLALWRKRGYRGRRQPELLSAFRWEDYTEFQKHLNAQNMMAVNEGDPRVQNNWRSRIPQFWLKQIILKVDYATEREGYYVGFYDFETNTAKIKREVIRGTRFFRMRLGPGKVGFIAVSAVTGEPRTIFYEAYIDLKNPYAVGGPLPSWFFETKLH